MEVALSPEEEQKIVRLAQSAGATVSAYLSALIDRLPEPTAPSLSERVAEKLARWQAEDGSPLLPNASAQELFARWRAEDAASDAEQRRQEHALWVSIEQALRNGDIS